MHGHPNMLNEDQKRAAEQRSHVWRRNKPRSPTLRLQGPQKLPLCCCPKALALLGQALGGRRVEHLGGRACGRQREPPAGRPARQRARPGPPRPAAGSRCRGRSAPLPSPMPHPSPGEGVSAGAAGSATAAAQGCCCCCNTVQSRGCRKQVLNTCIVSKRCSLPTTTGRCFVDTHLPSPFDRCRLFPA